MSLKGSGVLVETSAREKQFVEAIDDADDAFEKNLEQEAKDSLLESNHHHSSAAVAQPLNTNS